MSRRSRAERLRQAVREGLIGAESVGTTSLPFAHPQRGVRETEMLTGAQAKYSRARWTEGHAVQHLCFPPEQYPQDVGPGSQWRCACGALWQAYGVAVHQYPTSAGFRRNDAILGPEYWLWVVDTGTDDAERYLTQQAYWDWRPAADKILAGLQRIDQRFRGQ